MPASMSAVTLLRVFVNIMKPILCTVEKVFFA
jgi:hypothetical protein